MTGPSSLPPPEALTGEAVRVLREQAIRWVSPLNCQEVLVALWTGTVP